MIKTQVVAKAIILDDEGKFLLLTRSQSHPKYAGFYDLPGGGIEEGEEPGAGLRREISEETGLVVDSLAIRYTVTKKLGEKSFPTLLYIGFVNGSSPDVTLSYEHGTFEWAQLHKLAEVEPQIAPTYREALEYLQANGILAA